mmetsp:Transcript_3084/g.4111  ORF Transcript_3084/g.4111 Transcript_3084/m.4111 type:complete len:93 (-) Transcript_3084:89-367(-)
MATMKKLIQIPVCKPSFQLPKSTQYSIRVAYDKVANGIHELVLNVKSKMSDGIKMKLVCRLYLYLVLILDFCLLPGLSRALKIPCLRTPSFM